MSNHLMDGGSPLWGIVVSNQLPRARVSWATANLKEAGGKLPTRGTRTLSIGHIQLDEFCKTKTKDEK